MSETYYNPLSHLGSIKESLVTLLKNDTNTAKLVSHCFDTPYGEESMADKGCGIFVDTNLIKVSNQRFQEIGIDIYVICHKDFITLSEEDKSHFHSLGIYGNRLDSTIQSIHSAICNSEDMSKIKPALNEEAPVKQYAAGADFFGKQMSYTYQTSYQRQSR